MTLISSLLQLIHPGTLTTPQSPIIPHTPFAAHQGPAWPHTPFTPFTAFAHKTDPFDSDYNAPLHLLDDNDNPLAVLYNQTLRFVERDVKRIMEIADRVSIKSSVLPRATPDKNVAVPSSTAPSVGSVEQGFDIMANVVWAEIGKAIMDDLGGIVFAAGRPSEFRQVYPNSLYGILT